MTTQNVIKFGSPEDVRIPEPKYMGPQGSAEAVCWAFMGASGGAGVTSLCLQIAHELAAGEYVEERAARVCVFDLDFENGSCAQYLDLEPIMTHADLGQGDNRLDQQLLEALTLQHEAGFDVLAAPKKLDGNSDINPLSILTMLDLISREYDYVILDVPRLWNPWTHAAIGGADRFNFVSELTIPSIQNIQKLRPMIRDKVPNAREFGVVINKHDRRSFRTAINLSDAKNALRSEPDGTIGFYSDIVREAINRGEPIGAKHGSSKYVREVRNLIKFWVSDSYKWQRHQEEHRLKNC